MPRTERAAVRLRPVEKRLIAEAAEERGESFSGFVRRVTVREATETVLSGADTTRKERGE